MRYSFLIFCSLPVCHGRYETDCTKCDNQFCLNHVSIGSCCFTCDSTPQLTAASLLEIADVESNDDNETNNNNQEEVNNESGGERAELPKI